jgi:thiol-disulfide isomerase/thioredoxin
MSRPIKIVLGAFVVAAAGVLAYLAGSALRPPPSQPMAQQAPAGRPVPGRLMEAATRQPLADVTFTGVDGREHRLSEFRGQPVLVNFWATWCPPCIAEMPSLDALQGKLGTGTFKLIALSQDRGGIEVAKKWLDQAKLANIVAYHADQSAGRALGTQSQLPVSILVDKQGREVARVFGAMHWDTPEMAARIQALARE